MGNGKAILRELEKTVGLFGRAKPMILTDLYSTKKESLFLSSTRLQVHKDRKHAKSQRETDTERETDSLKSTLQPNLCSHTHEHIIFSMVPGIKPA